MPPKRKQRRNYSNRQLDESFWSPLKRMSAYRHVPFENSHADILESRRLKREQARSRFKSKFRLKRKAGRPSNLTDISRCLSYWVQFQSWTYCKKCYLLEKCTLHPKRLNSKGATHLTSCICRKNKYIVPSISLIPSELRSLSKDEENILRIFTIDIGTRKTAFAGHRVKNGAFELRYREDTVQERPSNGYKMHTNIS